MFWFGFGLVCFNREGRKNCILVLGLCPAHCMTLRTSYSFCVPPSSYLENRSWTR